MVVKVRHFQASFDNRGDDRSSLEAVFFSVIIINMYDVVVFTYLLIYACLPIAV